MSFIQAPFDTFNNLWTNQTNMDINNRQMEFAEKNLSWQQQAYREGLAAQQALFSRQIQSAEEMQERELEYNSLPQQVARAKAAGINPGSILGNGSTAGGSVPIPSPASPSSPSGVGTPAMIPAQQNHTDLGQAAMEFKAIADVVKAFKEGGLDEAKANEIDTLLDVRLKGLLLSNQGQSLINNGLELDNFVKNNVKDEKVKEAVERVHQLQAEVFLLGRQGELAQLAIKRAELDNTYQDLLNKDLDWKVKWGLIHGQDQFDTMLKLQKQQYSVNQSQIGLNQAKAGEANASANLQKSQKVAQDLKNRVDYYKSHYTAEYLADNKYKFVNSLEASIDAAMFRSKADYEEARKRIRQLREINDGPAFVTGMNDFADYVLEKASKFPIVSIGK